MAAITPEVTCWRAKLCVGLALAVVTLAVYWPVRRHGFINYDDPAYVAQNQHVLPGLTWAGAGWAFGQLHGERTYWHPLTWLAHMVDCQLFGLKPAGHHLMSVAFHALNAMLVFLVFLRMTGAFWRCAVLAGFFALHPLQVDTVAWVAERKNLLSAFFGLLALWTYVGYASASKVTRASSTHHAPRTTQHASRFYLLSLLLFALSLMSKPALVTLPFLLLLLDCWPLQRLRFAPSRPQLSAPKFHPSSFIPHPLLLEKLPYFALAAASSLITIQAHRGLGLLEPGAMPPAGFRLANALVSYMRYLGKALWPSELAVFYPLPAAWPLWTVAVSGVLLLAVTALVIAFARRRPYLLVGWCWFAGALVPCIGLIQAGAQALADRFAYLPLVGLFLGLVWAAAEWSRARLHRPAVLSLAAITLLLLCGGLTRRQVAHWQDTETLFRHALAVTEDNFLAHGKLGEALAVRGRLREAEAEFSTAIKLYPACFAVMRSLAMQLRANGNPEAALSLFNLAVQLRPDDATAHYNLAVALADQQQVSEAVAEFNEALRLDPNLAPAHNNLASLLLDQGKAAEGLAHALAALNLKPDYAQAHVNAGNALFLQEKFTEAAAHYAVAAKLDPANAEARLHRGKALVNLDRPAEAESDLKEAARLQPSNAEPHQILAAIYSTSKRAGEAAKEYAAALDRDPNWTAGLNGLAWMLATHTNSGIRNGAQAVQLAMRACSLTGSTNAASLETLAAAYAEAGMFDEAVRYQQLAVDLATGQRQDNQAALARHRLELYRSQKPCREP